MPAESLPCQDPDDGALVEEALLHGTNEAVRGALGILMAGSTVQGLAAEVRGRLEIVLAEVLNNIVEHAYRDGSGPISLQIARKGPILCFRVEDRGHPMPDGNLPRGELPTAEGPDGPSEGGFGWFLIRSLTEGLSYRRCEGVNRLCFAIRVN